MEFLLVALVLSLTPGPATATVIRVAARDGRRAALGAIAGHSVGVLLWAALSAVGVSALVVASEVAYTGLRVGGAAVLVWLGLRSLLHRDAEAATTLPAERQGWRTGLATGLVNPKLAVFFVALFPQFLAPGTTVLPAALGMAAVLVAVDVAWFSTLAWAVDRAGTLLRPRVRRGLERVSGCVMVTLGLRLAVEG